jgi:hypothetical protein
MAQKKLFACLWMSSNKNTSWVVAFSKMDLERPISFPTSYTQHKKNRSNFA